VQPVPWSSRRAEGLRQNPLPLLKNPKNFHVCGVAP